MSRSPYSYRSGKIPGGNLDVWEPVASVKKKSAAPKQGDTAVAGDRRGAAGERQAVPAKREPINGWGQQLLDDLPSGCRLDFTAEHYPHVVNKVAVIWNDLTQLTRYLDGLLLADRNNRQGFAYEALMELTNLREARIAELRTARGLPPKPPL